MSIVKIYRLLRDATLAKAQGVGVKVLSPANRTVEGRMAMVEFPGGDVAEIHERTKR